jgi:hypothetical protein
VVSGPVQLGPEQLLRLQVALMAINACFTWCYRAGRCRLPAELLQDKERTAEFEVPSVDMSPSSHHSGGPRAAPPS